MWRWISVFALLVSLPAMARSGFDQKTVGAANRVRSIVFPVGPSRYMMVQPDGEVRTLERSGVDHLAGGGWTGKITGSRISLKADGGQPEVLFEHGRLVRVCQDGRETAVDPFSGLPQDFGFAKLVRDGYQMSDEDYKLADSLTDIWKVGRFRLWFRNPNVAGTFLMMLTTLAFSLLFGRFSPWLRIHGLMLALIGTSGLLMTQSRSAFIGLLVALGSFVLVRVRRGFSRKTLVTALAGLTVLLALSALMGVGQRFTTKLADEGYSSRSRLPIWKAVPAMMADAPGGWGFGRSGDAYVDWYQALDRDHHVRALLNSHVTWCVEFGWIFSLAYLFAWLFVLLVFARALFRQERPLAFAVWSSFALAMCFNHVGEEWQLWPIPVAIAVFSLIVRPETFRRSFRLSIVAGTIAVMILATTLVSGSLATGGVPIAHGAGRTLVNGEAPETWIVDGQYVLSGLDRQETGRQIREFYRQNPHAPALGFVSAVEQAPLRVKRLVLAGKVASAFVKKQARLDRGIPQAEEIIFLSPTFRLSALPRDLFGRSRVKAIYGEFSSLAPSAGKVRPESEEIVRGMDFFISDWVSRIMQKGEEGV